MRVELGAWQAFCKAKSLHVRAASFYLCYPCVCASIPIHAQTHAPSDFKSSICTRKNCSRAHRELQWAWDGVMTPPPTLAQPLAVRRWLRPRTVMRKRQYLTQKMHWDQATERIVPASPPPRGYVPASPPPLGGFVPASPLPHLQRGYPMHTLRRQAM